MKVLITGGSGHVGREVARLLRESGDEVRVLSRQRSELNSDGWIQGDLATGEGIDEAVAGVDMVVHAATLSRAAVRGGFRPTDFFRAPSSVDVEGTRRLLEAAERESVSHLLHVSIVGVENSRLPYMRVKLAGEELVRNAGVPWSIVRATGFYWLLDRFLEHMKGMPIWPLPRRLDMQPGDEREFAAYVVECTRKGASAMCREFAGPEVIGMRELARQYQQERRLRRPILPLPLPEAVVTRSAGGLPADNAVLGKVTWEQWLHRAQDRVAADPCAVPK